MKHTDTLQPSEALRHWARWAVDYGAWRQTCYSAEGRYALDKERYGWPDDAEKQFRFRYDTGVGELAERLVNQLPDVERQVLRARHVHWPHLADHLVARRLAMSARAFDTVLCAATVHFGQLWRSSQRRAA